MAKISLANILSGFNITRINDNFQKIADTLNNQVLYRDNPVGEPNTLKNDIDVNSHHILNLPAPTSDNEPARLKDVKASIAGQAGVTATLINFEPTSSITTTNVQGAIEQAGTYSGGSVARSTADKLRDTVSVWDFMDASLKADALSGTPILDHATAWNAAITSLGGRGKVLVPSRGGAKYRLASTIYFGTDNTVDSEVFMDIENGVRVFSELPNISDVLFSFKNVPGHFNNQGMRNLHVTSLNGFGTALLLNGQCFGCFENIYIEGMNAGIYFSNAGYGVFNEFIRFRGVELHLNHTGVLMAKDGTDTSMHGISFRDTTINVGAGQVGMQFIDVCWYNADFDLKFFSQDSSEAIIKMSTSGDTYNKGVFGCGSVTCEGIARLTGTGRFHFPTGKVNFDVEVIDTLVSPDAWEQGFMASNYIKEVPYGSSGLNVAEVLPKSGEYGSTGPIGSFARLRKANVESLLANSYDAHASSPGNGFYTGYTGYRKNYNDGGALGIFLSSDGTEISTKAPLATQCVLKHNDQYILRFDGQNRGNSIEGFLLGSGGAGVFSGTGSPEGVLTASVGSTYHRRDGGATSSFYVKESGSASTGWVAK